MFQFRLQSVLEVRERLARLKQKEFAEAVARHQVMESEVEQHQVSLARAGQYVDGVKQHSPTLFALHLYDNYRRRVEGEIQLIEGQMREQAQELEAKRQALVEAKRAQRTLEILKEKAQSRAERELGRRERATMDEVASTYHHRHHR